MKKIVFVVIFTFFAMSIFGQIPSVVVSDFTSRARDVHSDDLVTVMEMFKDALAIGKSVNVIDRSILEKGMKAVEFGEGDWSDSAKTTKLGENLNAIYLVNGTITQLGTSLTFTISVRDIKTLVVISSEQKQYTLDNIWDNSLGIPAQLSTIANNISKGISADYNKRQQEIQAQLAREKAEKDQIEADKKMGQMLIGTWRKGGIGEYPGSADSEYFQMTFNSDNTFGALYDYWDNASKKAYTADVNGSKMYHHIRQYWGTYTREGTKLTIKWESGEEIIVWQNGRTRWEQKGTDYGTNRSGNSNATINIFSQNQLEIKGFESFSNRVTNGDRTFFTRQ